MEELFKKSNYNDSNFSELRDHITFRNDIRENKTSIEEARYIQEEFNKYIKQIKIGKKNEEQKKQNKTKQNNNKKKQKKRWLILNGRNDSITFVDDYGSMVLDTKRKATQNIKS